MDIDNLAKFVLDGLIGIAYADDAQVVQLVAYKMCDSLGDCSGGTLVRISTMDETTSVLPDNYTH